MTVPSPGGEVKIVSSISTFVINTLTIKENKFLSTVRGAKICLLLVTNQD